MTSDKNSVYNRYTQRDTVACRKAVHGTVHYCTILYRTPQYCIQYSIYIVLCNLVFDNAMLYILTIWSQCGVNMIMCSTVRVLP